MKVLTGNRLSDGIAVWYSASGWIETLQGSEIVADKEGEARLEAVGKLASDTNYAVDINLIDVDVENGVIQPTRLRERIRAGGPTNRTDLGKQAEGKGVPAV
jgi:hypothetical protein